MQCDKCRMVGSYQIIPEGISDLIKWSVTYVECANPNCIDTLLILSSRHKFKISLEELILAKLNLK